VTTHLDEALAVGLRRLRRFALGLAAAAAAARRGLLRASVVAPLLHGQPSQLPRPLHAARPPPRPVLLVALPHLRRGQWDRGGQAQKSHAHVT